MRWPEGCWVPTSAGTGIGSGVANAVQTNGNAYLIGVDTDWTVTAPKYTSVLLTSIVKKYDVSVVQVVKTIEEDKFTGGVHLGTLETGEMDLAPFRKFDGLISPRVKVDLAQIRRDIINGQIQTKP